MTRKGGKKKWFPCSFGKTQKHHILVLLTHLFNELEKKAIPSSKAACNVQFFPCSGSRARQTFWIYCAGTAALAECPTPSSIFLSSATGMRKTAIKTWACTKTSLRGSCLQLCFQNSHFDLLRCLYIFYKISFQATFCFFRPFPFYFLLYFSSS